MHPDLFDEATTTLILNLIKYFYIFISVSIYNNLEPTLINMYVKSLITHCKSYPAINQKDDNDQVTRK